MNTEKNFTTLADGGMTGTLEQVLEQVINYGNNGLPSMETDSDAWKAAAEKVEAELNAWAEAGAVGRFRIGDEWIERVTAYYRIDYNTGAGNFEIVGDLEKAQAAADEGAAYTGQPIVIYDNHGNEVSRREWYNGVKYNPDEAEAISPIVGDYGYYADWTD